MRMTWLKYVFVFSVVMALRLFPFRVPNVEPALAAIMPFSKRMGVLPGVLFGVLSVVLHDVLVHEVGSWTWGAAFAYGVLAVASYMYFMDREATVNNVVRFMIPAIIAYDAFTGVVVGSLFGHQSFGVALAGQIPVTMLHLFSAVVFAALVSPALYRWAVVEESFSWNVFVSPLRLSR